MARLPVVSGNQVIAALERVGFIRLRQKGDHVSMGRRDPTVVVTVPLHKEVAKGTIRAIIRDANLTVDQFISLLP